jgi:hypothetical protein
MWWGTQHQAPSVPLPPQTHTCQRAAGLCTIQHVQTACIRTKSGLRWHPQAATCLPSTACPGTPTHLDHHPRLHGGGLRHQGSARRHPPQPPTAGGRPAGAALAVSDRQRLVAVVVGHLLARRDVAGRHDVHGQLAAHLAAVAQAGRGGWAGVARGGWVQVPHGVRSMALRRHLRIAGWKGLAKEVLTGSAATWGNASPQPSPRAKGQKLIRHTQPGCNQQ